MVIFSSRLNERIGKEAPALAEDAVSLNSLS